MAWPERTRLGCRDRTFCFSASSMGENPLFSVGLLQWAKWWRQVPLSPNEDRKMGMVEMPQMPTSQAGLRTEMMWGFLGIVKSVCSPE